MDGTVRIHRNPIEDNYTRPKSGRQWIFHSIVSMATTDKLHLIRTFSGSWQWQLHCALAFVECIAIMLGAQRCVYAKCARKTLLHTKYTYAAWTCCCYIQAKYDCTYVCRAHIYILRCQWHVVVVVVVVFPSFLVLFTHQMLALLRIACARVCQISENLLWQQQRTPRSTCQNLMPSITE